LKIREEGQEREKIKREAEKDEAKMIWDVPKPPKLWVRDLICQSALFHTPLTQQRSQGGFMLISEKHPLLDSSILEFHREWFGRLNVGSG